MELYTMLTILFQVQKKNDQTLLMKVLKIKMEISLEFPFPFLKKKKKNLPLL